MSDSHAPEVQAQGDQPGAGEDTESDPSLDDGTSADWSDEGGATPEGPAADDD